MATPSSPDHKIRVATLGDAQAIAMVHVATWQNAYQGIVPHGYLAALDVNSRAEKWRDMLLAETPTVLVAVQQEMVVGWIAFGPSRDEDMDQRCAEIEAVYVSPALWKQGIGTTLMNAACERLGADGYSAVALWVLKDNAVAQSFYARRGFEIDGSVKAIELGGASLIEVRLSTKLHGAREAK